MLKKRALPTPACIPVAKSAYRLGSRGGSRAPLGPIPTPVAADDGMMPVLLLLFFFDGLDDFLFVGLLDFFDAVGLDDDDDDVTDSNMFVVSVALGVGVKLYVDIPVLGVVIPPPLGDGNAEISSGVVVIIETFGVDARVMAAGGGARDVVVFVVVTVIADAETPPPPPLSPLPDAERTLSLILLLTVVVVVVVAGTSTTVPSGANATGPAGRSANGSSSPVLNPPNVGVSG